MEPDERQDEEELVLGVDDFEPDPPEGEEHGPEGELEERVEEPEIVERDDGQEGVEPSPEELVRQRDGILGDLRETRARERQLADRLAAREAEYARIEERSNQLLEWYNQQAQQQAEAERLASLPDPDEDPVAYITEQQRLRDEQITSRLDRMEQERAYREQMEASQQQDEQFHRWVAQDVQTFRQREAPDYDHAMAYTVQHRAAELARHPEVQRIAEYNGVSPEEYAAYTAALELQEYGERFARAGQSPARALYGWAQSVGWTGEGVEPQEGGEEQQQASRGPRRGSLRRRRESRQGADSVGGPSGRAPEGRRLTGKDLRGMSDQDWAEALNRSRNPESLEERMLRASLRDHEVV